MGFSAGGHLATPPGHTLTTGIQTAEDAISRISCRPDFLMLVYPVIVLNEDTHRGFMNNLFGKEPSAKLVELFSNEKHVTARTPPTFLAHAQDDKVVPPQHSQAFYAALQAQQVPSQYLELPSGGHGLNGYKGPMWDAWQEKSLAWLARLSFITPEM